MKIQLGRTREILQGCKSIQHTNNQILFISYTYDD